MAITPGTLIAERYEILEAVGHGGMARVFRARRRSDGTIVALKVLYDQYAHAPEFVTRFEREARAAASLDHPCIVRVQDSGRHDGARFLVMEYVEGSTLKDHIAREGALSAPQASAIAAQVCEALEYAHSRGIVHRDIKPQNILLTRDGTVKVADFGIARALEASTITQPGSVLGSAQYLSPEQARGDAAGKASDIYALGVVLYEMVTGRLPFSGESPVALALKHIQEAPRAPRSVDPRIPAGLERIILRAMAKRSETRYASAAEMRDDLLGRSTHWQDAPTAVLPPEDETVILAPEDATAILTPTVPRSSTPPPGVVPVPRERSRAMPILAVTGVLAALIVSWVLVGAPRPGGTRSSALPLPPSRETVTIPDLRGLPLDRAQSLAAQLDLQVAVRTRRFHDTYAKDVVIDQTPKEGGDARRRSVISVVLSRGAPPEAEAAPPVEAVPPVEAQTGAREGAPEPSAPLKTPAGAQTTVEVPDLRGAAVDQAGALLESAGLHLGSIDETSLTQEEPGRVVAQFPAAGSRVPPGTAVNLLVSAGR